MPSPTVDGELSVDEAIATRRSVRSFKRRPISMEAVGQLLWAAQGVSTSDGRRTAPSAGALYPLEVYLVAGNVTGLEDGVYKYGSDGHALIPHRPGDLRNETARAALGQSWMADAPVVLVITAVYQRTRKKYGSRAERYVHMEVGHAAQNVYLQARSLDLGTTMVGAFNDEQVKAVLSLPANEAPLALLPVGWPE